MPNVLATNAYLVNVPTGQGAGYDPDMLEDCARSSLEYEAIRTDTEPDFDSCYEGVYGRNGIAINQRLWNGTVPPGMTVITYMADLLGNGNFNGSFTIDLGNGQCTTLQQDNVTPEVYAAAQVNSDPDGNGNNTFSQFLTGGAAGCQYTLVDTGGDVATPVLTDTTETEEPFVRLKQKGQWQNPNPNYAFNQFPVRGGVDDVSRELMRTSVINEWAQSFNPDANVTDYFTQWVLTFPTKHYYVDLQTDLKPIGDDISPTLVDLDEATNDAFAPFSMEFNWDPEVPGTSCEPFYMQLFNREESWVDYTSPRPPFDNGLCWETNVINFNDRYSTEGLASSFAVTIPEGMLPWDYTLDKVAERGWAELWFTGPGASVGLFNPWRNYFGLPVTGFLFSVYNTTSPEQNHTTINAHKYTREYCYWLRQQGDTAALVDGEYRQYCEGAAPALPSPEPL
jgi:hypothetical protein